jgi:hypothetical protein
MLSFAVWLSTIVGGRIMDVGETGIQTEFHKDQKGQNILVQTTTEQTYEGKACRKLVEGTSLKSDLGWGH